MSTPLTLHEVPGLDPTGCLVIHEDGITGRCVGVDADGAAWYALTAELAALKGPYHTPVMAWEALQELVIDLDDPVTLDVCARWLDRIDGRNGPSPALIAEQCRAEGRDR
jgi:hypothetical protein